jgi:hypothetical protein
MRSSPSSPGPLRTFSRPLRAFSAKSSRRPTNRGARHAPIATPTPAAGIRAAVLNLRHDLAYASLVSVASRGKAGAVRVIPGDANNSYVVQKLEGAPGIVGERMPRTGGPYLTEGQLTIIKRWIATGANND